MDRPTSEELLKHAGFLRALAYRLSGDHARADDLVQDAYLAALEKPPRGSLRAWLSAVVRNLASKGRRSDARRRGRECAASQRELQPTPHDVAARIAVHRDLVDAVDALEEPYRTVIVLRFFYDEKPRDIAARLDVPVETVRTRTKRALALLRGRVDSRALALLLVPLPAATAKATSIVAGGLLMNAKLRIVVTLLVLALFTGAIYNATRGDHESPARADGAGFRATDPDDGSAAARSATTNRESGADAADATGTTITFRGLVLADGEPAESARVEMRSRQTRMRLYDVQSVGYLGLTAVPDPEIAATTTDAQGRFEITGAASGELVVDVIAPGAVPARVPLLLPVMRDVTIHVRTAEAVTGTVVDPAGLPVAGATVYWRSLDPSADVRGGIRGAATTDETGRFELPGGRFWARVSAPGYAPSSASLPAVDRIVLERGGIVEGEVRDAAGTPLPGALVLLATSTAAETRTDAHGRYRLRLALGPLTHALVHATGHPPLGTWSEEVRLPVAPVTGDAPLSFDVALPATTALRGRVVEGESPVAGAAVRILRETSRWGFAVAELHTDDAGRFECAAINDGRYRIEATTALARGDTRLHVVGADGPVEATIPLERRGRVEGAVEGLVRVRMVHLGTASTTVDALGRFAFERVGAAAGLVVTAPGGLRTEPFDVRAGETTRVTLETANAGTLSGRVVDADGRPVAGAKVFAHDTGGDRSRTIDVRALGAPATITTRDGRFSLLVPDTPALVITHPDAAPAVFREFDADADEHVLELAPGRTITGHVTWEDGSPVTGGYAKLEAPADADVVDRGRRPISSGRVTFRGVPSSVMRVEVEHDDGATEPADVPAMAREVTITLRRTASILGVVVDRNGDPVSAARITATATGQPSVVTHSTELGRFSLRHLAQTTYDLALEPGDRSDWVPPRLMPFTPTTVSGVEAGKSDVRIVVDAGRTLKGRLLTPSGEPVVDGFVAALGESRGAATTRSGPDGRFSLAGVGEGHRTLLICARGWPRLEIPIPADGGEIRLATGSTVRVRVLGADGKPLAGQHVSVSPLDPDTLQAIRRWREQLGDSASRSGGLTTTGAKTDDDGIAEIGGLDEGEYRLGNVWAGDATSPAVTLRAGAPMTTIRLEQTFSITGRVVDADGAPVGSDPGKFWITVNARRDGEVLGSAVVYDDGKFEIKRIRAGAVELEIGYSGGLPAYHGRQSTQAGARDVEIVATRR